MSVVCEDFVNLDIIYLPLTGRQMSYRGHVKCIQEDVLFGSAIARISFGHD